MPNPINNSRITEPILAGVKLKPVNTSWNAHSLCDFHLPDIFLPAESLASVPVNKSKCLIKKLVELGGK